MDDKVWGILSATILGVAVVLLLPPQDAKEIVQMILTGLFGIITGSTITKAYLTNTKKETTNG